MARQLLIGILMVFIISSAAYSTSKKATPSDDPDTASVVDPSKITETLIVDWPEGDKWIPGYLHKGNATRMQLYFPEGQSSESWWEMASIETVYGKTGGVVGLARQIYLGTVRGSSNATWDILKKGNTENGRPFTTIEIICPDFLSGEPAQVQIWKLIMGKTGLYTLQYSFKGKEMPAERKEQILESMHKAYLKVDKK